MKTSQKKLIKAIVVSAVSLILIVALTIGNVISFQNFNVITSFLCGQGFKDNENTTAVRAKNDALAQKVEEAGAVMLKNENNVLPMKENNRVNVFGWAGSDNGFLPQGTGSGTGSRNNLVTFYGGLREAGFEINEELAKAYNALDFRRVGGSGNFVIEAYSDDLYKNYYGVTEADSSFLNTERVNQAKNFSDQAIIVLGRLLGEGNDYSKVQYVSTGANDTSRKLQHISDREEAMIKTVCDNFDKVVLVLNTTNPMELGFVDEYDIDSVIFMGMPGTRGSIGIGNILAGKVTPSGKVSDTWAYDISTSASYATSGREGVGSYLDISTDTSLGTRANKYSDYLEDIYVGYKWYETADAEGFWNTEFAKTQWNITSGYNDVVQYPFGFGLSYTTFEWTIEPAATNAETLAKDGKISFDVYVHNTGEYEGADVVQVYYSAPYTSGGIEKSALNLATFAKTGVLQPDETEKLTLTFDVETMKSYDCYDRNNNGFMGYELEGGAYTITLRTDAHTVATPASGQATFTYTVPSEGYRYETDTTTGNKVENLFTNYTNTVSGASSTIKENAVKAAHSVDGADDDTGIVYMTRSNFVSTFPVAKPENREMGKKLKDDTFTVATPVVNDDDVAPTFNSTDTEWTITDLFGVEYEDPMWDELVSQLSMETCAQLICKGGFGTIKIESIGKPETIDTDGPTGFNNTVVGQGDLKAACYPSSTILAQTWDWYMAYQVGMGIGEEGTALSIQGWYGPGANLHRSVMGGRNFEYYSEDPILSGYMCAYHVLGAKKEGVTAYIKHIAVNDSESGRNGAYKWLTEQNMRENYLKVFEIAVKVGKANAMMSSVDRIGSTRAAGSWAMLTGVLRNEWGFNGTVITDYYQNAGASRPTDTVHDVDECVRAGNSQLLFKDNNPGIGWFNDTSSNTAKASIYKSAKDILYTYADTLNYHATANELSKDSVIGTIDKPFAWWVVLLGFIDVTALVGLGLASGFSFRGYVRSKREEDNAVDGTTQTAE